MNLENSIKDVITQKLEDGTVEKLISEEFEKGIKSSLESLFRSYGSLGKIIEKQIESVIVPYLESYDYSRYVTKLDVVLTEVLKNTTLDNNKILENFKHLAAYEDVKEIKISELFSKWMDYVASNVNTDGLEVEFDDGVRYEWFGVTLEVEYEQERDWSIYKYATVVLECGHDEEMNVEIRLKQFKNYGWEIVSDTIYTLNSLRSIDEFSILLMNLAQSGAKVIIDVEHDDESVRPEAEPEASFS